MNRLKPIALVAGISTLVGLAVYGAIMVVYRIAQAQAWPPALTNFSPFVALAAVWFLIGRPVARVLERRSVHRQHLRTTMGEVNAPQRTPTKSELIWKIGVLYWGGLMFLFFAIVGPIIPHFTMGKPLTMQEYISSFFISAVISFPAGAIFGLLMWRNAKRNPNALSPLCTSLIPSNDAPSTHVIALRPI